MKLIGAGFPRTGTASQKVALELLGLGPCYHFYELFAHPQDVASWRKAAQGEPVDWVSFLQGWNSTVDWPGCSFYREMADAFPDAKVLLSVRDPERWYESFYNTIYQAGQRATSDAYPSAPNAPPNPLQGVFEFAGWHLQGAVLEGRFAEKDHAIAIFNRHIKEVKRTIPADRLLVFDVKQGWEPLCAFLGLPVPDQPFPHVNDTAAFWENARRMFETTDQAAH
jgi:hypothetical protein